MRGKIFGTLFGLIFLGVGGWIGWATVHDVLLTFDTRSWTPATCTVTSSSVELPEGDEDFRFVVSYRYRVGGRDFTGDRYRHGYYSSQDSAKAYRLQERFPTAARVPCWIDPDDPGRSILELRSFAHAGWLLLPLVMMLVSGGALYWMWGPKRRRAETSATEASTEVGAESADPSPIEAARQGFTSGATGCMVAFFGVFFAAGFLVVWFTFLGPWLDSLAARDWVAADCEVVRSRVQTHSGDDSDTYSVDILYRYRFDGREYHADRYEFLGGSSSGYQAKAEIVEQYPPGHRFTCWVDPDDPAVAVIHRELSGRNLVALMGLPFLAAGLGGIIWTLRKARQERKRRFELGGYAATEPPILSGPHRLKPKIGPVGKILLIFFVAAFWNGITGVFVWQIILGWRAGAPDGCLTLFILPFVAVGLLLLLAVPHTILAAFNPRPHLTVDPAVLTAGETATLGWGFRGAARRIRKLRLELVGKRTVTSRGGGETRTKTWEFRTIELHETEHGVEIPAGEVAVTVPDDIEPTSDGDDGKVSWFVKVHGTIRWWPDVREEMQVEVRDDGEDAEPGADDDGSKGEESEPPPIPPPSDAWEPPAADV